MPEELPKPKKSLKQLEKENKKVWKNKQRVVIKMDNCINKSKFLEEIRNVKAVSKVNKCDNNTLEVI